MLSSMRKLIDGRKPYNKLIISVIKDEEKLKRVTNKIKEELNYFSEPGIGFMFVIPVLECYGSKEGCPTD
jgi:nitrogen regulatory protein PII